MPVPQIGPDELLVKVLASGICGSDVMEWYRIKKAPRVLVHEIAGEIVGVCKEVRNYKVGDRVFVSHHVPCNTCQYCLNGFHTLCDTLRTTNFDPGGFAEYLRVPRINVDRGVFVLPNTRPRSMTFSTRRMPDTTIGSPWISRPTLLTGKPSTTASVAPPRLPEQSRSTQSTIFSGYFRHLGSLAQRVVIPKDWGNSASSIKFEDLGVGRGLPGDRTGGCVRVSPEIRSAYRDH